MTSPPAPTIDVLLNAVPDHPQTVLAHLARHPHLAGAQDSHGYSLLHAAASYSHPALLRALVQTYSVSPDLVDEDGETPLFVCEAVDVARCLVEELGATVAWRNKEGQTAEERLSEDADFIPVAAYLRQVMARAGALPDASAAARVESERVPTTSSIIRRRCRMGSRSIWAPLGRRLGRVRRIRSSGDGLRSWLPERTFRVRRDRGS